ncbi:MAG: aminotransferase class V-fold PLP-dependent enzyme, partial [Chlorobiales bacterium]|nr:aminotransferase class V-fold PLP-dependent enzyme [Chlorobiales bacterium]
MSQAPFTEDFSNTIYLDNAATVFPKPSEVLEQMIEFYRSYGVNAGRSGHDLAKYAGQFVDETRRKLTRLFGGDDPNRLIFCNNCTDALNILLNGLLEAGDHVITTTLEHNSVIRPLNHLRKKHNVDVSYVPFEESGFVDPERIKSHIKTNTRLVLVNHGSNVIGTIQPASDIGRICRERDICFAIDSAQTAGVIPINMAEMKIDAVAFTGHKGLLGPTGIGGLCLSDRINIEPTRVGGTGVRSSEPLQPAVYPYL